MTRPRPIDHLESVSRDYPGVWRQYDRLLAMRGNGLPEWPSWCHCPMAGAYAVVSGGGEGRVPLERSLEISRVAALAAWRPTQGIEGRGGTVILSAPPCRKSFDIGTTRGYLHGRRKGKPQSDKPAPGYRGVH